MGGNKIRYADTKEISRFINRHEWVTKTDFQPEYGMHTKTKMNTFSSGRNIAKGMAKDVILKKVQTKDCPVYKIKLFSTTNNQDINRGKK